MLSARWNHVDDRAGASRPDERDYDQVDLTLTARNVFADGLDVRIGVNNILDERIVHLFPGPLGDLPFRFEDRTLWLQLSWRR